MGVTLLIMLECTRFIRKISFYSQAPEVYSVMFLQAAIDELSYVTPLHPHTGFSSKVAAQFSFSCSLQLVFAQLHNIAKETIVRICLMFFIMKIQDYNLIELK